MAISFDDVFLIGGFLFLQFPAQEPHADTEDDEAGEDSDGTEKVHEIEVSIVFHYSKVLLTAV